MSDSSFDFNLFIKESKDVLVNPKSYFSTMKTTGGMAEPLIKAVIYGAIAGALTFIWSLLGMGALGGAIGIMAFIWSIIAAIIGLFIIAVIVLVISSICKGNTDFEANMRVTAAVMVIMPISSLFGFAGHLNLYLGIIIGLAVYIFALWLLYNGLVEALKTNAETTKIVSYVLIAIIVLIMLLGFKTRKYMYQFNDNLKELPKEIEKN
jgi:hypothetical protein